MTAHRTASSVVALAIIATALLLTLAGVAGTSPAAQDGHEWRDYAGGPDSSRFLRATGITRSNVARLQVAWTYPAGQTDFNPLVVRGIVYGRGRDNSLVALDAETGKLIWIHALGQSFNSRGVNYWESQDGTGRRLLFSAENFAWRAAVPPGDGIGARGARRRTR